MYRQTQHRRSAVRVIALTMLVAAYVAVLVVAGNLTHPEAVTPSGATAALSVPVAGAPTELAATDREAPLATLGIALVLVAGGFGWYAIGAMRGRSRRGTARAAGPRAVESAAHGLSA